jgi:hypothetical protein
MSLPVGAALLLITTVLKLRREMLGRVDEHSAARQL